MIRVALSSIACLNRSPAEALRLVAAARLDGIEWGEAADDPRGAEALLMDTLRAGATVASFAPIFRLHGESGAIYPFEHQLERALRLQAPILRVYAGTVSACRLGAEGRALLADELRRLADLAARRGVTLCLSFGKNTSLDSYESALLLLDAVNHPFVRLAWEPLPGSSEAEASAALEAAGAGILLAKRRERSGVCREPLAAEAAEWRRRFAAFLSGGDPKMSRFVLLGSLGASSEGALTEDAAFLSGLAAEFEAERVAAEADARAASRRTLAPERPPELRRCRESSAVTAGFAAQIWPAADSAFVAAVNAP